MKNISIIDKIAEYLSCDIQLLCLIRGRLFKQVYTINC